MSFKLKKIKPPTGYLTIIPRAWMASKSIAHEAGSQMGYWLRGHDGERNNCLSKIQLVGQKYRDKTTLSSKTRFRCHCFGVQSWRFLLLVGYNIQPSSSSTNQSAALKIDHYTWILLKKIFIMQAFKSIDDENELLG